MKTGKAFHIRFSLFCAFSWFLWLLPAQAIGADVNVRTADGYVFGGYKGKFVSPPSADSNPRRAVIVNWSGRAERLVFWHEASYCPFFELSDGSGACFQFFEGNDGWAELFNQFGRMEKNSFAEIVERGPRRVHVRWTYFGVNEKTGERAYQAIEDFHCLANGLVLRRQAYQSLKPKRHEGYAREPIELIGMCPAGKLWKNVLATDEKTGDRHALAALDPFSDKRYDVYWRPKEGTLWEATPRRDGSNWKEIDDAAGVVLVLPMRTGSPFCAFGTASGFNAQTTRVKEHTFSNTTGGNWISSSWDHWPVGWLNSQAHVVDAPSLAKFPNHFSPAGMDFFAVANEEVARGEYWSLVGVGREDLEVVRRLSRKWLELGMQGCRELARVERLSVGK
jgi:hypothetical protein